MKIPPIVMAVVISMSKDYRLKATGMARRRFVPIPHGRTIRPFPYVYGGLIASVIDCHSTGTAAAAAYRAQERPMDSEPVLRFLTASLKVDYLKPTPIAGPLTIRARVEEIKGRKVVVVSSLYAGELECARGHAVCVQAPEDFLAKLRQ